MTTARSKSLPKPDVDILTYDAIRITEHSSILVSGSSMLENIIDRPCKHQSSERVIPILGVPYNTVLAFIHSLYSSRSSIATSFSMPNASLPCRPWCHRQSRRFERFSKYGHPLCISHHSCSGRDVLCDAVLPNASVAARLCAPVLLRGQHNGSCRWQFQSHHSCNAANP
ncbi:hypothetical protein ACFX15_018719 [Malus domestica]